MLNLYINGITSCAVASHIALEEAGADYKVTRLDYAVKQQRSPEYLKINPKGRVPALATDRGIITETPAILYYIGQTFSAAGLIPADPFDIGQMQDFNSYLCSTVHPVFAHAFRGERWSDDPAIIEGMKVKVPQNVHDCFALIQKDYLKGPWIMGTQFTVADIYLYTLATWLDDAKHGVNALPKVIDHRARVAARPAVQRVRSFYG